MDKKYTAKEMREMATEAEVIEVADQFYGHDMDTIAAMLRQAADAMEHSQTETAVRYEYAVEDKFKGEWRVDLNVVFSSLDEAEDYMNMICEMNPFCEFRIVRRPAEWEVVE